ncbi:MAG TPA: glycine oxidase ThiO [Thermoanaerobaculia bacterium]
MREPGPIGDVPEREIEFPTGIRADVAIVGAGVIGCSLARELAGRGREVVVIDRRHPGAEASSAAAGLLSPQNEARGRNPFFDLGLESRELHASLAEELAAETGVAVGYRRCGILRCTFAEEGRLWREFGWQAESALGLEVADRAAAASWSAERVSPHVSESLFFPNEAIVDGARLTQALALSAERRGARILRGVSALRFLLRGGACLGVDTDHGLIEAGQTVDAAGAWASFDSGLPFAVPVVPIRGQMVELQTAGRELPVVVQSDSVYLVPRAGGSVLAGATLERVGFHKQVTARGITELIGAAVALVPDLAEAAFVRAWAGLRPGTPDEWPILGPTPVPGLFLATGHYRNGILLAPITARLLADLLTGATTRDLTPFSIARFADFSPSPSLSAAPPQVFG